jgi:hypothetical protein
MKRYIFPLLFILILGLFQACKEQGPEKMIPPTPAYCLEEGSEYLIPLVDSCRTQPFPRMGNIWTPPEEQKYLYGWPFVSPLDKNVIVYTRRQTDTSGIGKFPQVWTMNLCTGEKELLASELASGFAVSTDGWLMYRRYDGNWKVKLNGDSLTQLETLVTEFDWHPSGDQIIGLTIDDKWALLNADGQIIQFLDSIRGHNNPLWSPDAAHIVFSGFTNEGSFNYLYEVANQQIQQIPVKLSNLLKCWADNDHLYTATSAGDLVKLNIHTYQVVEVLKPACVNKTYVPTSHSNDGQHLLCGYNLFEEITPGSPLLNRYTKLVVMNLDGSNEREIVVE